MLVYCSPKESSSLIAKELVRYTGVHTTSEAAMKFATAVLSYFSGRIKEKK